MISIEERKAIRRTNVARLLDQFGQTKLAEITEISPALLYQLGKARGKSKRNVNDQYARDIEDALDLGTGWMDADHSGAAVSIAPTSSPKRATNSRGPYRLIKSDRWYRLSPAQRQFIEEEVERLMRAYEAERSAPRSKKR